MQNKKFVKRWSRSRKKLEGLFTITLHEGIRGIRDVKMYGIIDPFVKKLPITRKHKMNMKSIKINKTNIKQFDAIVILTDHDNVNYNLIKKNSKMIFDSRGVYKINKKIIRI